MAFEVNIAIKLSVGKPLTEHLPPPPREPREEEYASAGTSTNQPPVKSAGVNFPRARRLLPRSQSATRDHQGDH
jgi:hypothetical protein